MISDDSCHIWWFAAFSSGATLSLTFCFDKRHFLKGIAGIAVNFSVDIHGAPRMSPDDFCQLHLSREIAKHLMDWQTLCKDNKGFQMLTFSVPTPQGWHLGGLGATAMRRNVSIDTQIHAEICQRQNQTC